MYNLEEAVTCWKYIFNYYENSIRYNNINKEQNAKQ